ncbi:MAG: hypothetical protein WCK89_25620 [bacterium]
MKEEWDGYYAERPDDRVRVWRLIGAYVLFGMLIGALFFCTVWCVRRLVPVAPYSICEMCGSVIRETDGGKCRK